MSRPYRPCLAAVAAALAALAGAATPAPAAERVATLDGVAAPRTPSELNRVKVVKVGRASARNVLVMVPGTSAGGPYFLPLARDLVRRLPGWQVWAVERRENLLEDHSVLDEAKAGRATAQQLFDHYLGWIGDPAAPPGHFTPRSDEETGYARRWGMGVAVGDLRQVVRAARRGGRRVSLAGHSLGGSIIAAYASWDFAGRPGAREIESLVFIDGVSAPGRAPSAARARASLRDLRAGSPWLDLTGLSLPWSAGVFNAVGSTSALIAPDEPSILHRWPLLPANLKAPVQTTNLAGYGYALDVKTGPSSLALVQSHIGHLADSGDPRGWVDDGLTTARRTATVFSGIPGMDGTAWYHPRRLSIDSAAVNGGVANPAQKVLGVRAVHGRRLRMPMYAIETSLGRGRILSGTRALARRAGVPRRDVTLVDASATNAHIDPISDLPERNELLRTVVPFLERVGR